MRGTKHCPDCNRDKPASEFVGYNNRRLKRCQSCRTRDLNYRHEERKAQASRACVRLQRIECTICHARTVARTPGAPTLVGWTITSFEEGKGVCHEHAR